MNEESHLKRETIEALLKELGQRCQGRDAVEMVIVGGAAMALEYRRDRVTRDIDAIFEPKMMVYQEAKIMAAEHKIPADWLNDAVKGLLPEQQDQGEEIVYEWPGIKVRIASAEYMFAMKVSAARVATDTEDILALAEYLGITTAAQALAALGKYYSPERLLPKSSLLVESLFPEPDGSAGFRLRRRF